MHGRPAAHARLDAAAAATVLLAGQANAGTRPDPQPGVHTLLRPQVSCWRWWGGGGQCGSPAWNASTAYVGGSRVSFNRHTWTAKWWTQGDTPGNNAQDVWTDNGPR